MKCEVCNHKQGSAKRSVPQHRRFFGMLKAYLHHWPETASFQPDNIEHLRAWSLVKAKYRNIVETSGGLLADVDVPYSWSISDMEKGLSWLVWPRSIAFDELKHSEACRLFDDVSAVLEAETGLQTQDVMRETENAT